LGQNSKLALTIGQLIRLTAIKSFNFGQLKLSKESTNRIMNSAGSGVILSGLVPLERLPKKMFDDEHFQQRHKLMKAMDEINKKFGNVPAPIGEKAFAR
jgi:hypothetical protein